MKWVEGSLNQYQDLVNSGFYSGYTDNEDYKNSKLAEAQALDYDPSAYYADPYLLF